MAKYKAKTTVYVNDRLHRAGEIVELPYPASPDQYEPVDADSLMAPKRYDWAHECYFDQRHYQLSERKQKHDE
jgi:hypothetical protein